MGKIVKCVDCVYWDKLSNEQIDAGGWKADLNPGLCRRHSPTMNYLFTGKQSLWPVVVGSSGGCGEGEECS